MIRNGVAVLAALTIFAGLGASACSAHDDTAAAPPDQLQTTMTIDANHHPTAHIGTTIGVQTDDPSNYGVGTQEYSVLNPKRNSMSVQVSQVQGSGYLGNFTALTDAGTRLDPTGDGTLPTTGSLTTGEVRRGDLTFDIPTGQHITKILVDQAYTVVAEWDL